MNLNEVKRHISNLPGWRTKRKLLVIESDDWGSVRMRSNKDREQLIQKGIVEEFNHYNRCDTLATKDDLSSLYEVLQKHKDRNSHPAVFTPVTITGNPDFEAIKKDGFENYHFEKFTETLSRYYGKDNGIHDLWMQGIDEGLFKPQFHGREHLNVAEWMRALQKGDQATRTAFDHGMWGFILDKSNVNTISSFQAAFEMYETEDLKIQENVIREGLEFFESLFGYRATFFVPPNGKFNNSLEKVAAENGINYLSRAKRQLEPLGEGNVQTVYHTLGKKSELGLVTLTRNCEFEPSQEKKDWVDSCLSDIKIAFRMRKPAIVSTHRVNFIGTLEEDNRKRGLKQLGQLLASVTKHWPEVEFITSDQLGDIITGKEINGQ